MKVTEITPSKRYFKNQYNVISKLEFENGWYYLTIGCNKDPRVSQSKDIESRLRILSTNGYKEME